MKFRIASIAVALSAATMVSAAPPQTEPPVPSGQPIAATGKSYDLTSRITKRSYRLFVYVPNTPPPPNGFPVIYMLDGNWYFSMAVDTAVLQIATGELPATVIVGVGYPVTDKGKVVNERAVDMSLPIKNGAIPPQFQSMAGTLGGLDPFLRFLKEEAQPFVQRLAPINRGCQTLFGHSLGGLAVLRQMFQNPNDYQSYVAASPAIFWDESAVLADEAAFTARAASGEIHGRLLLTVGALEQTASAALVKKYPKIQEAFNKTLMVDNTRNLAARLSAKPMPYFKTSVEIFPGEQHNSVIPTTINRALHFGLPCGADQ